MTSSLSRIASLLLVAAATAWFCRPAQAGGTGCEAVIAAMSRMAVTPSHQTMTETAPYITGTIRSEVVTSGSTMSMLVNGKWSNSPYDAKQTIAEMQRKYAAADAKVTCVRVGEQPSGGEPATLWKLHDVTHGGAVDAQIWISSARGLPLRQLIDIDTTHMDSQFDYANVQLPPAH